MLNLNTPENQQLAARAQDAFSDASGMIVDSHESLEMAVEYIRAIKQVAKAVEDQRKAITTPLDQSKKAVMDFFRPFSERCEEAERTLKAKCSNFQIAAARARREEEERARAAAAAEAAKLEQEAEKKIEEGDAVAASELITAAELTSLQVTTMPVAKKATGASMRDNWTFEVTGLPELIKAAANNPVLIPLLMVDESAARKMAGQVKDSVEIPGLRIYNNPIMSVR